MDKHPLVYCFMLAMLYGMMAEQAQAKVISNPNFSGLYACTGSNELVGGYQVKVTLKLKRQNEDGSMTTYDYITETENNLTYRGQAIVSANRMSIVLTLAEAKNAEFSIGMAEFKKLPKVNAASKKKSASNLWIFKNSYYESDDTGGNYGTETCVMQSGLIGSGASVNSGSVSNSSQTGKFTR